MADRQTKIVNFYESTLASLLASGATSGTLTTAPTTNGTTKISASSGDSSTHYYLVIDPDNSANREVILITQSTNETLTTITRDLEGRHSTDPDHQAGTTVRMAVLAEYFVDINDRLDTFPSATSTTTLTNKSISGSTNTLTNLPASQVDINGATDGTGIIVDGENDLVLLYDANATAVKKVKTSQIAEPADVHPFLVMGG